MSHFIKSGNTFRIADDNAMDIRNHLPAGNYIVRVDQNGLFFLEQVDNFTRPSKIYGDSLKNTDRIMQTFNAREVGTGVLLTGEKGSGKTLLARNLSMACAEIGYPCIIINDPYHGDGFNKLIQDIDQPCMILFDEFEKVYDNDDQEKILTLLDGVFPSKKLFVLTCNDKYRVNSHMRNRPGRIFYLMDFTGLEEAFIREYCQDQLGNKTYIDQVCRVASVFSEFNFDMLKSLIEEMNRFDESPEQSLKMLNAKPEFSERVTYDIEMFCDGAAIKVDNMDDTELTINPLMQPMNLGYYKDDEQNDYARCSFLPKDLKKVDAKSSKYVFENSKGQRVILTKQKNEPYNYYGSY